MFLEHADPAFLSMYLEDSSSCYYDNGPQTGSLFIVQCSLTLRVGIKIQELSVFGLIRHSYHQFDLKMKAVILLDFLSFPSLAPPILNYLLDQLLNA